MRFSVAVVLLALVHPVNGFAPAPSPAKISSSLQTAKEKHLDKWFFADLGGLADWFAPTKLKPKARSVEVKEDWVAEEFNKVFNADVVAVQDSDPIIPKAKKEEEIMIPHELSIIDTEEMNEDTFPGALPEKIDLEGMDEDTFPGALPEKIELDGMNEDTFPGALPEKIEPTDVLDAPDMKVEPAVFKKTPSQIATMSESRFAWVQRDMEKAGTAETEFEDFVAVDMRRQGEVGEHQGKSWVARDMEHYGKAENDIPLLKKKDKTAKTRNELIAEDMVKAGKRTGDEWVRQDMESAGHGGNARSWTDKLSSTLNMKHKHEYDDVYEDMKKTGSRGSDKTEWLARDMEAAGRAVATTERMASLSHSETYKLPRGTAKAFDKEWIRKDMEAAGHAEARDWVAKDMSLTGRNETAIGWKSPSQKKDLTDWVGRNKELIAEDMVKVGKSSPNSPSRSDNMVSRARLNEMVSEDMKSMGHSSTSWVAHDMKLAGHAEEHTTRRTSGITHMQRETEEFMKTRKPIVVPWVPTFDEYMQGKPHHVVVDDDGHIHPLRTARKAAKKVIMPWRPWSKL